MTQPTLFDSFANREPIAANVDPISSHLAAAEITRNGLRGKQKLQVLEAVIESPGRTSAELAAWAGMDRYAVARRLPDLRQDGFVEQGPMRKCKVTGKPAVTWKALVRRNDGSFSLTPSPDWTPG